MKSYNILVEKNITLGFSSIQATCVAFKNITDLEEFQRAFRCAMTIYNEECENVTNEVFGDLFPAYDSMLEQMIEFRYEFEDNNLMIVEVLQAYPMPCKS